MSFAPLEEFEDEVEEFFSPKEDEPIVDQPKTAIRKRKNVKSKKTKKGDSGDVDSASPVADIPNADAKTKAKPSPAKKRKIATAVESEPRESTAIGPKKTKNDAIIEQFMIDTLPALRKNIKQQKATQENFKIRNYAHYFKSNSGFLPTFILPLFHFLGKEEIICSRVSDFNGKKFVKTEAGFHQASLIANNALDLTDEERDYLMKKFGKEYFKIPTKDYVKAASACKYGEKNEFRVTLVGLYEDSFLNDVGEEISTINPILRYDPIRPKPEKKKKEKKEEKKEKEVSAESSPSASE